MAERFAGPEDDLTERIIGVFYAVFNELGFGFNEVIYSRAMALALKQSGLKAVSEMQVPVSFRGELLGTFRADLVVEDKVVELKVADAVTKAHEAQLLHYLRATSFEIGLILNFGTVPKVRRMQFRNTHKGAMRPGPS